MPKEKVDELKAKYPTLSDETIDEIVHGLKVANAPGTAVEEEELPPPTEPDIFAKLGKGEITMGEALIYLDYVDRKEERRKASQNPVTPEKIAEAVVKGIKEALPPTPTAKDEMPPWAKEHAEQLKQIASRLVKEEEDKRLKDAVEAAVKPVAGELEKAKEEIATLREQQGAKPEKGELETTKETLKTLKEIDDLRGKPTPPEKSKDVMIDLNEEIANALGEEIKNTIMNAVKEKLTGEGAPAVTTTPEGTVQVNWYNLGQRALKTIEKFIEKLPVAAPPKGAVKEMAPPQLPTAPTVTPPSPPPAPPAQPTVKATTKETATATETPPSPPSALETTPPPAPPQSEVATEGPPTTEEVATATPKEEESAPQEESPPQLTETPVEESQPSEKPEKMPKIEEKPQKPSKKNEETKEEQKEEAEEHKTIIAESTTKGAVVEEKVSELGGSEETLHGGSHTEKSHGESAKSN